MSCVVYPRDNVPGGSFSRGNYVGDKSSERHSGAISRGILSGANYLWDNFPGAILQGAIIRGAIILGGNCPDTYFYVSKSISSYTFCCSFLKLLNAFSVSSEAATRGVLSKGVLRNFAKFTGKLLRQSLV